MLQPWYKHVCIMYEYECEPDQRRKKEREMMAGFIHVWGRGEVGVKISRTVWYMYYNIYYYYECS